MKDSAEVITIPELMEENWEEEIKKSRLDLDNSFNYESPVVYEPPVLKKGLAVLKMLIPSSSIGFSVN